MRLNEFVTDEANGVANRALAEKTIGNLFGANSVLIKKKLKDGGVEYSLFIPIENFWAVGHPKVVYNISKADKLRPVVGVGSAPRPLTRFGGSGSTWEEAVENTKKHLVDTQFIC